MTKSNERDGAEVMLSAASQTHAWSQSLSYTQARAHTHPIMVISDLMLGWATPKALLGSIFCLHINLLNTVVCNCYANVCACMCVLMRGGMGASGRLQGDLAPSDLFFGCFRMDRDERWQTEADAGRSACTHPYPAGETAKTLALELSP